MNACDGFIPKGLLENLKCNALPTEADGPGACISKPGNSNIVTSCLKFFYEIRMCRRNERVCVTAWMIVRMAQMKRDAVS